MDEGTANVEVTGNTIVNCTNQGIFFHNAHDIKVLNNTIFTANNRYMAMSQSANKPLVKNNTISGNIFFSNLGTQTFLYLRSDVSTNLTQFGNFSGNYYARPSDNNTATVLSKIKVYELTAAIKSFTTACRFEYNATTTAKTIALDASYVDAKNKSYSGSITLQPYTSLVLIRTGSSSLRSSSNTVSNVSNNADTAILAISKPLNLKVFPNPAVNKIQLSVDGLQMNNQKAQLSITNLSGIIVKSIPVTLSGKTLEAEVSSLSQGLYIVSFVTDNFKASKKFLKN